MSNIEQIISQLEHDQEAISRAISALREVSEATRRDGAAKPSKRAKTVETPAAPAKKRQMTPEGRRRISEAAKRRWAAERSESAPAKTTRKAKKASPKKASRKKATKAAGVTATASE